MNNFLYVDINLIKILNLDIKYSNKNEKFQSEITFDALLTNFINLFE